MALEMSLRGYGETFQQALDDLVDAIEAQVSFALQHDTLESIWTPAEPYYVELYQKARQRAMRAYLEPGSDTAGPGEAHDYAASDLVLPKADRTPFVELA
jgi:hypothetical protein